MPIRKTNPLLKAFLSFSAFIHSVWLGVVFFKDCLFKGIGSIYDNLVFLVERLWNSSNGSCRKYAGFFLEWYLYAKKTLIAKPILLIPTGIAEYYVYYYLYWVCHLGWWLAFAIVRARFLACLHHTVRIIENTVIGKVIFFGSLAFLSHHLGYAYLSPAHLHALLTEILHIRNYMPPVPPLEPEICHEVIQSADPKSPWSLCRKL